jgi:hypothetical protein
VSIATVKSCVFNLHGAYADGSNTDSTSVDFCKRRFKSEVQQCSIDDMAE